MLRRWVFRAFLQDWYMLVIWVHTVQCLCYQAKSLLEDFSSVALVPIYLSREQKYIYIEQVTLSLGRKLMGRNPLYFCFSCLSSALSHKQSSEVYLDFQRISGLLLILSVRLLCQIVQFSCIILYKFCNLIFSLVTHSNLFLIAYKLLPSQLCFFSLWQSLSLVIHSWSD